MLRSMFSSISGLRSLQTMMDVIGNNIANVNTVGYKSSSVTFQSLLYQTIGGATASTINQGGTNPQQIGLGAQISAIADNFAQGSLQNSGRVLDMSIQGDGFFVVTDGVTQLFSRAGAFDFDNQGSLVDVNGNRVLGWVADTNGNINTNVPVTQLTIPGNRVIAPQASYQARYAGNLDARVPDGTQYVTSVNVYDSLGVRHSLSLTFTKTGANAWDWAASADNTTLTLGAVATATTMRVSSVDGYSVGDQIVINPGSGIQETAEITAIDALTKELTFDTDPITTPGVNDGLANTHPTATVITRGGVAGNGTISFNPDGTFSNKTSAADILFTPAGASPLTILDADLDFSAITQYAAGGTAAAVEQNGYSSGVLTGFALGKDGTISGVFSNGLSQKLAQVALATFNNNAGLMKEGSSLYRETINSGAASIGAPETSNRGQVTSGALEMSNVDMAREFTNLIVAQRAFQATSRMITSSDEVLQELVNLRR